MSPTHIIAHTPNAWGHIKPLLAFFGHIADRHPASVLTLTLFTSVPMLPKIQREFEMLPGNLSERVNVIDVGAPASLLEPMLGFIPAFEALWEGKPVVCKTTNKEFKLLKPKVAIIDPFCEYALPTIRKTSAGACAVIAWVPSPMSSVLYLVGPEEMGGHGDLGAKLEAAVKATGKPLPEIADSVYERLEGKVAKVPGVPDLYDYEYFPQENIFPFSVALVLQGFHRFMVSTDGALVVSSSAFERGGVDGGRKWFGDLGKDLWVVGPLEDAPPAATASVPGGEAPQHAEEDKKILGFLDDMNAKYGDRSVIFIAFGTNFYPKDTTKLHAFIDELLQSGTPFLWSHASPFAKVPEDLAAKITSSGHGFHSNWVPQRAVLGHKATGWFVSHGGWNSTQEALSLRVPMIMWPFSADQPANSAILSIQHEAAFELLSVREARGARQPLRLEGKAAVDFSVDGVRKETRELLQKIKGPEGKHVRTNAEKLGSALEKSWKEGGEASEELNRFLSKFLSA